MTLFCFVLFHWKVLRNLHTGSQCQFPFDILFKTSLKFHNILQNSIHLSIRLYKFAYDKRLNNEVESFFKFDVMLYIKDEYFQKKIC